jgi:Tol biopolymer transport system component
VNKLTTSRTRILFLSLMMPALAALACAGESPSQPAADVPHQERWGIYALNLESQAVELIYSSPDEITTLRLNTAGDRFVISQQIGGEGYEFAEIFTLGIDGQDPRRLTENACWDLYPAWSSDGTRIVFLSWRGADLDLYVMNADGSNLECFFDSGGHDADVDWVGDRIVFTSNNRIWIVNDDATNARPVTEPPQAGEWGNANLPYGDYDPRLSPDGGQVAFERMVDVSTAHGSYDLFVVDIDGTNLKRLTNSGYSQGFPNWSHDGDRIVYVVAAIEDVGQFDFYLMNSDGSDDHNITPSWFPPEFLCHTAIFSANDEIVYFIGEWWDAD